MSVKLSKKYIDLDANDPVNGLSDLDIREPNMTFSFDLEGNIQEILYDDGRKIKYTYESSTGRLVTQEVFAQDGSTILYKYTFEYSQTTGDLINQEITQY